MSFSSRFSQWVALLDDGHLLFSLKKPGEAGVGPLRPARPRRRKPMLPFALVLARATPASQIDG